MTAYNLLDDAASPPLEEGELIVVPPLKLRRTAQAAPRTAPPQGARPAPSGKAAPSDDGAGDGALLEEAAPPSPVVRRVFKALFWVCLAFFAGELAWLCLITPLRPLSNIEVAGAESSGYTRGDILERAGIGEKTSYLLFNEKAAERKLAAIAAFESARVTKLFPETARITLVPRVSVALFLQTTGGKSAPAYVDRHGVVFAAAGDGRAGRAAPSVPVVSGLDAEDEGVTEGARLSAAYTPLFESLARLARAAPQLYEGISELRVNRRHYDGYDITLFPLHQPVRLRMNAAFDEETLGYMFLLLDVLQARGEEAAEIDFRMGTPSYIMKG